MEDLAQNTQENRCFLEMRRKVQEAEVLSGSMARLLEVLRFSGRISVVLQNGRVVKSGYEEGYFRRQEEERLVQ
jgi:sulfur carrier protein ThiS